MEQIKVKFSKLKKEIDEARDEAMEQRKVAMEFKSRAESAEAEKDDLARKAQLQDEDLTRVSEQKDVLAGKLTQVEEQAELHIRATKALENRNVADEDKITRLEKDLIKEKASADHNKFLYDEVSRKFTVAEQDLERSDDRCKELEAKLAELQEEVSSLQAARKSAEARYEKASEAEENLQCQVQKLNAEKEALANQEEFTNRSFKTLQCQLESAEDNLNVTKEKLVRMQMEHDQALSDLGNF